MNNKQFKIGQEVWTKVVVANPNIDLYGEIKLSGGEDNFFWVKPKEIMTAMPEKPILTQFVADYMKYAKSTFCSLKGTICFDEIYIYNYANWSRDKVKLIAWMSIEENQEVFAKAWLFGYEVEQEKLYTVEIPDPHGLCNYRYLLKNSNGVTIGTSDNNLWKSWSECQLTEEEIKKDFEWAWKLAKPVEE